MTKEIERKFLVKNLDFMQQSQPHRIAQGYICSENDRVVRIRRYDDRAVITVKNATIGFSRDEFEYAIPIDDAEKMLRDVCLQPIIEKTRYLMPFDGFTWEIDVFEGDNRGLIIAEIELPDEGTTFAKPDFIGDEVTGDVRYYNANLIKNPYSQWK